MEKYLMTNLEIKKNHWITLANEGKVTVSEAAEALGLSTRQIKRLKKGVKEKGVAAIIHGNRSKVSPKAIPETIKQYLIELKLSDKYKDANFTHFLELVKKYEFQELTISYPSLCNIMKKANIKSPKKHNKILKHHRRKPKEKEGLMLQIDGSPHDWLGIDMKTCIHGAIDDATGKITGLYMTENECLEGYFEIFRQTIHNFGIPSSVYSDRHLIIHPTKVISIEDQLQGKLANESQFSRAMRELNIILIRAYSAQAKGKIENLWGTLQSRLVVEFKLNNIKTIEQANKFLKKFIPRFNNQFAKKPVSNVSAFTQLPSYFNLDYCLCVKETRILDSGCSFSLFNNIFNVLDNKFSPKTKINVLISKRIGILAQFNNMISKVELISKATSNTCTSSVSSIINDICLSSIKKDKAC
jgi:DNA-binding Lrp family transcriptional regulator